MATVTEVTDLIFFFRTVTSVRAEQINSWLHQILKWLNAVSVSLLEPCRKIKCIYIILIKLHKKTPVSIHASLDSERYLKVFKMMKR